MNALRNWFYRFEQKKQEHILGGVIFACVTVLLFILAWNYKEG